MKWVILCTVLCVATAKKHEVTDEASKEAAEQRASDEDLRLTPGTDYYYDLDLDSLEDAEPTRLTDYLYEFVDDYDDEYEVEVEEGDDRIKRKVIFGGGGGYGGVQRRGGGGRGDPYGRRRGNNNQRDPDYGIYDSSYDSSYDYEDSNQNQNPSPDTTSRSPSTRSPSTRQPTTTPPPTNAPTNAPTNLPPRIPTHSDPTRLPTRHAPTRSRAYGIVRSSPDDVSVPSTTARKSKTGRRAAKRKLPRKLKMEIAKYALQHGHREAMTLYTEQVGRRINEKKIEKFVQQYQRRQG